MNNSFRLYSTVTIVFTMLIFYFTVAMQMDIMNVMVPIWEADYGWSRVDINHAVSAGSAVAIAASFIGASLALVFGIKAISTVGLFLVAASAVIVGLTETLSVTCGALILAQAAAPLCLLGALTYNTNWFVRKRGWALGIATMAFPIGSASFTPSVTNLIMWFGKEAVFSMIGVIVCCIAILGIIFIKTTPEERGLVPDGIPFTEEERDEMKLLEQKQKQFSVKAMFTYRETYLILVGNGLVYFMMTCIMANLIPRFLDTGIPMGQALLALSVAALGGIPISYLWGILDDRMGTPKACTIFALTYTLGMGFILFASPENPIFMYLTVVFIAGATAGHPNLTASIVSYVYGRVHFIRATRFINLGNDIARTLSFSFMAFIFGRYASFDNAYKIMMTFALVAGLAYISIRKSYDPDRKVVRKPEGDDGVLKAKGKEVIA